MPTSARLGKGFVTFAGRPDPGGWVLTLEKHSRPRGGCAVLWVVYGASVSAGAGLGAAVRALPDF